MHLGQADGEEALFGERLPDLVARACGFREAAAARLEVVALREEASHGFLQGQLFVVEFELHGVGILVRGLTGGAR